MAVRKAAADMSVRCCHGAPSGRPQLEAPRSPVQRRRRDGSGVAPGQLSYGRGPHAAHKELFRVRTVPWPSGCGNVDPREATRAGGSEARREALGGALPAPLRSLPAAPGRTTPGTGGAAGPVAFPLSSLRLTRRRFPRKRKERGEPRGGGLTDAGPSPSDRRRRWGRPGRRRGPAAATGEAGMDRTPAAPWPPACRSRAPSGRC